MKGADDRGAGESEIVFSLVTRRIGSLSARQFGFAVAALAAVSLMVAVVFSALGAWMILPFAGLEAAGLFWAYRWVERHAQDSESLVIRGHAVTLAVRVAAQTRQYEFNRAWAKLVVEARSGYRQDVRLALRSHGHEVEVGRYLDGGGRQRLAQELRSRLS